MSGSNPPSTNGSPRLARRALTTSLAALGAVAVPLALVATTGGSGPSALADQAADGHRAPRSSRPSSSRSARCTESEAVPFVALSSPGSGSRGPDPRRGGAPHHHHDGPTAAAPSGARAGPGPAAPAACA